MAKRSDFGHIRQRANGRWQARFQDGDGHQHSKTFPTSELAAAWLAEQSTDRRRGVWTDPRDGRITVKAWSDRWRTTIVDLRPSTLDRDLGCLERYVLPTFGTWALADVGPVDVQAWVAELRARGLAAGTVVKAAQVFGKVMSSAVTARMIPVTPLAGVRLPRVEHREMRFLEVDEMWRLADTIDPRWRGLVVLGAGCGLRIGEMLGLKVGRVDRLHRKVDVAEICTEVAGHHVIGPPKTRRSRRVVPAPRFVIEALAPHLDSKDPDRLVFEAPHGGYVHLAAWRSRTWQPACQAVGLDGLRLHDLRHAAIAWWIAAGADPVDIARRAGHTSTSVVLDRYGHIMAGRVETVTDALDALAKPSGFTGTGDIAQLR